ncbi:MAG: 2'-5' RNA ligase family protein [Ideonella sp.]|nr:2'-5' RNA ligase family protein [Ideonella sp.]MCC7458844.1 2'-5' RNA ligase family protein [Nitrospira sp.]
MTSLRLFVALWPGPALRAALAARRDAIAWPAGAAPVPDAQLHLTLHFIGHVDATRLPQLVAGLWLPPPRLRLQLGEPVHWPHGLVVLPVAEPPDALLALHASLATALVGLGLTVERRAFRPHVTLARRAGGARLGSAGPLPRWTAQGYALAASAGGRYRVLARYSTHGVQP